jgi:hypothetical protein
MKFHISIGISVLLFCICSTIMSIGGDALAWHRMPKYDTIHDAKLHILRDYGHELIPYTCDASVVKRNMQTTVILFSLPFFIGRCYMMSNGVYIFNKFARLVSIMMLLRTITMISTAFPNPNPQCYVESKMEITYHDAIIQTISTFPTKSCGNLMFSGHTMFLCSFCLFEVQYLYTQKWLRTLSVAKTLFGIYYIIACRSHYTIDVVAAFLLTGLVYNAYVMRSYNTYVALELLSIQN